MRIWPWPLLEAMPPWPGFDVVGYDVAEAAMTRLAEAGGTAASLTRLRMIAVPMMPIPTMPTRLAIPSSGNLTRETAKRDCRSPARPAQGRASKIMLNGVRGAP
jgi:hypothetical protein